ncbi:MAG TPA: fluoride efflux transporter CrcB [Croceibacterium sp.]|nr:fluoride efflux transporter CrcB [Croceibacterium sp.]
MFSTYFWIGLGGGLGSMGRYGVSRIFAFWFGETFPWGTLVVNVSGSLLIGLLAGLTSDPNSRFLIAPDMRQFLLVGICGGYTTFSSFSLQTLALMREGDMLEAGSNIVMSVIFCLMAVWLGLVLAGMINQVRATG